MVDKHKRAIQKLWTDKCNIYCFEKVKIKKITDMEEVLKYSNLPCRISFKNISAVGQTPAEAIISQEIKLFITKDIEINENSTIEIIRGDIIKKYKCSGMPAIYSNHQEIILINEDKES